MTLPWENGPPDSPWDDPWNEDKYGGGVPANKPVHVLWDYVTKKVVGDGGNSLFDDCWRYTYDTNRGIPWSVVRYPGENDFFLGVGSVPEMVQLAVLVAS